MSVVLPARDQARYLREQIACLAAQDYAGDWELVVADNGSRGGSAQVAREAAEDADLVTERFMVKRDQRFRTPPPRSGPPHHRP